MSNFQNPEDACGSYTNQIMKLRLRLRIPEFLLIVSIIQIILHLIPHEIIWPHMIFLPQNKREAWRFFTYMLLHRSWLHLTVNVVSQWFITFCLMYYHGNAKIAVLYFTGGALGALYASFLSDDRLVGASAGVYALLLSIVSEAILNDMPIRTRMYRIAYVCFLVLTDVLVTAIMTRTTKHEHISWQSHIAGGLSGFLCGLPLLKKSPYEECSSEHHGDLEQQVGNMKSMVL